MIKTIFLRIVTLILYREAYFFRNRFSGPVIVITGSVGKTSAKEAIGLLVRHYFGDNCIVTPKTLNTEVGVPLSILGFRSAPASPLGWMVAPFRGLVAAFFGTVPKCMVLELGSDKKGDIAYLGHLTRPTHVIITNISESHSQFLGSLDEIRREKISLFRFLSLDGWGIVNGNDPFLSKVELKSAQHKVVVRLHERADYFVTGIKITQHGTEAILHHANRARRLHLHRFGEHHLYGVLFAAAVADSLNIPLEMQQRAFKEIRPIPGRGMLIVGKNRSLILDESYNAQPAAMRASLELLGQFPAKRRIAILGDMRELRHPEPIHHEIGKLARKYADYIIAVGPESKVYKANEWFLTANEAIPAALRQLEPGAIVLVKGSQNTIQLERIVKSLMANPSQAKQLLVRQEPEWLGKE